MLQRQWNGETGPPIGTRSGQSWGRTPIYPSKLKCVEFTLATGELFDAEVDAIVSSEQTDFVLSGDPQSLSGQIWRRYGGRTARTRSSTNGQVLGAGTVIDTSGGQDFRRIFHAGFHGPDKSTWRSRCRFF
jgi:hypothetical protein